MQLKDNFEADTPGRGFKIKAKDEGLTKSVEDF